MIVSRLGETRFVGGSAADYMHDHGRTAFTEDPWASRVPVKQPCCLDANEIGYGYFYRSSHRARGRSVPRAKSKSDEVHFDRIGNGMVGDASVPRREGAILKHLVRHLGPVANTLLAGELNDLEELGSNAIPVHPPRLLRSLADGAAAEINTMDGASDLLAEAEA